MNFRLIISTLHCNQAVGDWLPAPSRPPEPVFVDPDFLVPQQET